MYHGKELSNMLLICLIVGVVITTHPVDQFINVSDDVMFKCEASGSSPITYQWLYNGTELLDHPPYMHISGANTSTLIISNTNITLWGRYSCVASNIVNDATSNEATLHSKCLCVRFTCEVYVCEVRFSLCYIVFIKRHCF